MFRPFTVLKQFVSECKTQKYKKQGQSWFSGYCNDLIVQSFSKPFIWVL